MCSRRIDSTRERPRQWWTVAASINTDEVWAMKKKRKQLDVFLLPGIPTDKDLEELVDDVLASSRGQNNERPKRASSLSKDSAESSKAKGRGSEGRSRPRSPGARRSSGAVGGGKSKRGTHNRKFAQE